ncbi:hypothetical protein ACQKP8_26745 [Photobacterium alginatilyticum]|uniref:hypothetical protein n=1 Tax=Photobacterium alginatilyticum TaxID=1775171 RepID=UPI004068D6A7
MNNMINELKASIEFHRRKIGRINLIMWLLILVACTLYLLISVLMDTQINKLLFTIQLAIENGIGDTTTDPTKLATAGNNNLGFLVLGMCAARLFVYFGELRFHLKEMSNQEQNLFEILKIKAAQSEEVSEMVRIALLNSVSPKNENNPSLHFPSEAITKISDSVVAGIEKALPVKGN